MDFKKIGEQATVVTVRHSISKMVIDNYSLPEQELKNIMFRDAQMSLVHELWSKKCIRVTESEDKYEKHFSFSLIIVPPDETMHKNFIKAYTDLIEAEQRIKVLEKKLFDAESAIDLKNWALSGIAGQLRQTCHYELAKTAEYGLRAGCPK